jgi:hypothetical protein
MINQTASLTYNSIQAVTNHPSFLVVTLIVWFLPILLYIIIASTTKAKSSSGKVLGRMIFTRGTMIVLGVWFLFQAFLFLIFFVYPVWAKMVN